MPLIVDLTFAIDEDSGSDRLGLSVDHFLCFSQGFFLFLGPALLFLRLFALAFGVGLRSWPGHTATSFRRDKNGHFTTKAPIGS